MTREDLNELHALAASISDERRGWRAHRRARAEEAARRRLEAAQLAPVKRRRKHRWVAGVVVGAMVIAGAVLIVIHLPGSPAPEPKRTIVEVRHQSSPVRVGESAALHLATQGLPSNIFACQRLYDSEKMGSVPGQQGPAWRADYLNACLNAPASPSASR